MTADAVSKRLADVFPFLSLSLCQPDLGKTRNLVGWLAMTISPF